MEYFNKSFCDLLVKFMKKLADWDIFMKSALWIYRMFINSFIQLSLYMIVYRIQS